jgi:hypothetical protein
MLPTHMHLNATFMRSTGNWSRPDYPTEGGQKVEEYYGTYGHGGESNEQERDRVARLARFERAGGVHEQERERQALYEKERVRPSQP